jgi:hypothetical protein
MARAARFLPFALLLLSLLALAGCGPSKPSEESQWRRDVDSSLKGFKAAGSYRYRLNLESWVGVSGQNVYGDERGGGSFAGGNYQVSMAEQAPSTDAQRSAVYYADRQYLDDGSGWRQVKQEELPTPLYDPRRFPETSSGYDSVLLEGEEDRGGTTCQRYLLKLGSDKAKAVFPALGWSYFSQLRFEVNCRLWIGDPSQPPVSMQLEVNGFDNEEGIGRCRILATLDLYDVGSPAIEVTLPQGLSQ